MARAQKSATSSASLTDALFALHKATCQRLDRCIVAVAAWLSASCTGDLDTIGSLITDNVVCLTPGRPPFGKVEFLAASRAMAGVSIDDTSKIEELPVAGDAAYLRSALALTNTPPGGPTLQESGYTLTIQHKEGDGRWRLARDANLMI